MNAQIKAPLQRRPGIVAAFVRRMLRTQVGKQLAFNFGLKGFDRVIARHLKYIRDYRRGEKLKRGEIVMDVKINFNGVERIVPRVFRPKLAVSYNARVDKGAALMASLLAGSALGSISSPLPPIYIALSTSSLTAAKGDTTLSGETSVAGLGRALGTVQNYVAPAALDGAASFDIYKQFTLTGTGTTVVSTALFDASSVGNMFAEVNFGSSAVMATNDILQVTWTVNL